MKFSWKDVLDGDKKMYGLITYAAAAAKEVGYQYFSWNGWVYDLNCRTVVLMSEAGLIED